MIAAPSARVRAAWDTFLLKDRERLADAVAAAAREDVRALARAGRARAEVAERLLEGHWASAHTLYREAAIFYMAAAVAARTGEAPPDPLRGDDVLERFNKLEAGVTLAGTRERREAFLEQIRAPDPWAVERLGPAEAAEAAHTGRAVVRSVARIVEPRGVPEIRFVRRARVTGLGVLALAVVVWLISSLLGGGTNLALRKPVLTSGVHPSATSPPAGLTDGVTSGSYGVHTTGGPLPWVSVDLLRVYLVDKVKVYNRGDGWFDDGLPMTVQLSENGVDFVDVGTRTATFGQLVPWTLKVPHKKARYVRVRGGTGKYVALSELEVFGERP